MMFAFTNTTFPNRSRFTAPGCFEFTNCLFLDLDAGNQSGGALFLSGINNSAFLRISSFLRCFAKSRGSSGGAVYSSFGFLTVADCCVSDCESQFGSFLRIVNCLRPFINQTIEFKCRVVTEIVNGRAGIDCAQKVSPFLNGCNVTNCSANSAGAGFFLNGNETNLSSVF
jgi:hypothetical protein